MMGEADTMNPFWQFSLSLYEEPGVSGYCIDLQDRHGVMVNLLLFCCWLGVHCRSLGKRHVQEIEQLVQQYNVEVIQALRARRRQGLSGDAAKELMEKELQAEREEQDRLYEWFTCVDLPMTSCCDNLVAKNLQYYLEGFNGVFTRPALLIAAASRINCRAL